MPTHDPSNGDGPVVIELEDGSTITADSKAAAREAVDAYEASANRRRLQSERWGDGANTERMTRLCHGFPSLRRVEGAGVGPWDATAVLAHACRPLSRGERYAALFVLGAWNGATDWNELAHLPGDDGEPPLLGRFDLFDPHQQAALAWLERPFWP